MEPTQKIILVNGEEFRVDLEIDNEAIRQHLSANFPDIASATIVEGKRDIDGVAYQTFEFVKRAGTKSMEMEGGDLAALLATIPPSKNTFKKPNVSPSELHWLQKLRTGRLTFATINHDHIDILEGAHYETARYNYEGLSLCQKLEKVPAVAVASTIPCGW